MDDRVPTRTKIIYLGCFVVAVAVWLIVRLTGDELGAAATASWRLAPTESLDAQSTSVEIEVQERECASGKPADGRIVVEVAYGQDAVTFDVRVRRLKGDLECPSNPATRFVVALDEPLGSRPIRGENWMAP